MSNQKTEIEVIRELFKNAPSSAVFPYINIKFFGVSDLPEKVIEWNDELDMWAVYESGGTENSKLLFTFQIWTPEVLNKIIKGGKER